MSILSKIITTALKAAVKGETKAVTKAAAASTAKVVKKAAVSGLPSASGVQHVVEHQRISLAGKIETVHAHERHVAIGVTANSLPALEKSPGAQQAYTTLQQAFHTGERVGVYNEEFRAAFEKLKALGPAELKAIAKDFTGQSTSSKVAALKKIWAREQGLINSAAKSISRAGRSAA